MANPPAISGFADASDARLVFFQSGQLVHAPYDAILSALFSRFVGVVVDFGGVTAPTGWLLCFGQAVSRTTYSALFTAIGTTHGVGDGTTTFNLPDCRGRVVAGQDDMGGTSANRLTSPLNGDTMGAAGGSESHALTTAELAAHTHTAGTLDDVIDTVLAAAGASNGIVRNGAGSSPVSSAGFSTMAGVTASTGSGTAHNNVQPTIILNKIIYTGV